MIVAETQTRSASVNPLAIIERIMADAELSPSQYEEAKTSYEAVAAVLSKPASPIQVFRPSIRPQGSMRAGTTVRPEGGDRFDLDMLCWLAVSGKVCTPDQIYQWVWDALGEDATYRRLRKPKSRCIRIEYKDSRKFYLDVVPAIPDWVRQSSSLYVPDRELKKWCSSHPIEFVDNWFLKAALQLPVIEESATLNARSATFSNSVEPLPEYGEFEKKPLQRIVQLSKYDRNRYFQTDDIYRPSSVLLTTLITHSYLDAIKAPTDSLVSFVFRVLEKLPQFIQVVDGSCESQFIVANPVNPGENFAEKWTGENYRKFKSWHRHLMTVFDTARESRGVGLDVMLNRLSESFGNDPVIKAARALGTDADCLHQAGKLHIKGAAGTIGLVGATIPRTTYFGR